MSSCDIPDFNDQLQFELRCKNNMYHKAINSMTEEQIRKYNELNIRVFPLPEPTISLCKLCSILDKEQMEKISAFFPEIEWKHKTLHDWYVQHCRDDKEAILM
jgi:hypothetical protein